MDKANLSPVLSQAAGFVGAFVGSIAAQRRELKKKSKETKPPAPAVKPPQ